MNRQLTAFALVHLAAQPRRDVEVLVRRGVQAEARRVVSAGLRFERVIAGFFPDSAPVLTGQDVLVLRKP